MLQFLNQYANLINFVLLVAIVGWLFLLTQHYKEAITERFEARLAAKDVEIQSLSDRLKFVEEQLKLQYQIATQRLETKQDDLAKTEKWYERDIVRLQQELSDVLEREKITTERLVMNVDTSSISTEIKAAITELLQEIKSVEQQFEETEVVVEDPKLFLDMAKAFSSTHRWLEAAENYGKYLERFRDDWEVHFLQGVAFVNSRHGPTTDLAALRAYNEAIALAPPSIDNDMRARLFAYRAGVAKRLARLDEAEADLMLAKKYATALYEVYDIKYNLAAVYAMRGDKAQLLEVVRELRNRPSELAHIRVHLNTYFAAFSRDSEFLELIGA